MARIVAAISSRADLTAPLLERYEDVIAVKRGSEELAWGVGFYQAGEVLLRRRPSDDRETVNLTSVTRHLGTDLLLGHIRRPTTGGLRTENTHPFRYRRWLFAHDGALGAFVNCRETLLNAQPEFLRRNIRGNTDSEVLFYACLTVLHEMGALSQPVPSPGDVVEALRETTRRVEQAISDCGGTPDRTDMVITEGEHLFVVHRSNTMALFECTDPTELKNLLSPDDGNGPPLERFEAARVSLLVSALESVPTGWQRLEPGSVVTLSRTAPPKLVTL